MSPPPNLTTGTRVRVHGRWADDGALIAVCHEMVIRSLTGEPATGTGKFRRIDSNQLAD